MKFTTIITAVALFCAGALALDKPLNIEKTHSEECADSERTKIGNNTILPVTHYELC